MADPHASLHPPYSHPKCIIYHLPPLGTTITEYGVVHGGAIITIAETLSRSDDNDDWVLSCLLQSTYIDPFIRIDRNDGIVIPTSTHMGKLKQIYLRYIEVCSIKNNFALEFLWVPGLEPSYEFGPDIEGLDSLKAPLGMRKVVFNGEDMYQRHGKRRGVPFAEVQDRKGWHRMLWDLPRGNIEGLREEIPSEWITQVTCQKDTETGRLVLKNIEVGPRVSAADSMRVNLEGIEIRFVGVWAIQDVGGVSAKSVKIESTESVEEASVKVVEGATSVNHTGEFEKNIKQEESYTISDDEMQEEVEESSTENVKATDSENVEGANALSNAGDLEAYIKQEEL